MYRICTFVLCLAVSLASYSLAADEAKSRPLVLAHYMPWYVAPPVSRSWGWHWTMNHFDPQSVKDGNREIASKFYPLIGPYDSGDPHVLEYHLLQMKLAGIDGVIVDWYGLEDFRDYPILHRNTQRLIDQAARLGMKFAICYEDRTIPALEKAGRLQTNRRVDHAVREIQWLRDHWFSLPDYVRCGGQPVLLSFGQTGLSGEEWTRCLQQAKTKAAYFSQHFRRDAAVGAFDWPVPSDAVAALKRFQEHAESWKQSIPVAFPRFIDIYAEANVHESWGRIEDDQGATFKKTFTNAFSLKPPMIQIATWNDWGEGTVIEPSKEFGYRDLEVIQQLRRQHIDRTFSATAADLRLPLKLLQLRRTSSIHRGEADRIAELLANGELAAARKALSPKSK